MFFIVPIGHDELTLRGLPFGTIGLMAICAVIYLLTAGAVAEPAFAARFGYVPAHPGFGLLTYPFFHGGTVLLVLDLVFLWAAAVKLEAIWSRPVFLALFFVCGIVSALVHGAATSAPDAPLLGATGAVAGLMGASLVRLGRSKVYYAYFVWMGFKPKFGTFDAPAYLTPILCLVTLLGAQLVALSAGASIGNVSYSGWFGGFAIGCGIAGAFRLLHFEERVLHRSPELEVPPEDLPLVAFQRPAEPARPREPLTAIAASLDRLDRGALQLTDLAGAGGAHDVRTADVRAWTVGQIARAVPGDEGLLPGSPLRAQAVLLAFVIAAPGADGGLCAMVVDASRLKYGALLGEAADTPKEAFFKLVSRLSSLLPGAAFAGDLSRLRAGELPQHATLQQFFSRLGDAAILIRGR